MNAFPKKTQKRPSETTGSYLKYTGLAFQMIGSILLMAFFGHWLDQHFELKKPMFTLFLSMLAVVAILYKLIKNLNH